MNLFVDPITELSDIQSTFFCIFILMEFLKNIDSILNVFVVIVIKLHFLHTK